MALTTQAALRKDRRNARGPELQHRHYAVIAGILKDWRNRSTAEFFADRLRATNPNFDRDRFLRACGYEEVQ